MENYLLFSGLILSLHNRSNLEVRSELTSFLICCHILWGNNWGLLTCKLARCLRYLRSLQRTSTFDNMRCLKNLLGVIMLGHSIFIMIKNQAHGVFEILKLLRLNLLDLVIRYFVILYQLIELFCRKVLNFES